IHRVTGHDQLFDTIFLYESYPIDTSALLGVRELAITEFRNRESNHYPLSVMALPGHELGLRVEFDSNVFDAASIQTLVQRLQRLLGCRSEYPHRRIPPIDVREAGEHAGLDQWANRAVLAQPVSAPVS